jgi:hypothetical protein
MVMLVEYSGFVHEAMHDEKISSSLEGSSSQKCAL